MLREDRKDQPVRDRHEEARQAEREIARREAEAREQAAADRLRAELRVLEEIQRHGAFWPGDL